LRALPWQDEKKNAIISDKMSAKKLSRIRASKISISPIIIGFYARIVKMCRVRLSALISAICLVTYLSLPAFASSRYTVTSDARTLSEIALYLYGSSRKAELIARWNDLQPPYLLHVGQTLKLEEDPTLSSQAGSKKLLTWWERKFDIAPDTYRSQSFDVLYELGRRFFQLQRLDEAARVLEESREKNLDYIPSWILEIKVLSLNGKKDEASHLGQKLISLHPNLASTVKNLERQPQ
jgi:tetratricopeptide (TPR) repeat protein